MAMNATRRAPTETRDPGTSDEQLQSGAAIVMDTVPLTMRAIRREMRAGRDPALSVPQFRAMLFVRREPNVGLGAVAEHMGITAGAASELIERLVRQGLVNRDPDPRERRRVRIRLTERGSDQLLAAEQRTRRWMTGVLEHLDAAQLARLGAALADLRRAVQLDDAERSEVDPAGATRTEPGQPTPPEAERAE